MGDPDSMSMARSYYAQALKLNNKNVRALYGFFLVCSLIRILTSILPSAFS